MVLLITGEQEPGAIIIITEAKERGDVRIVYQSSEEPWESSYVQPLHSPRNR